MNMIELLFFARDFILFVLLFVGSILALNFLINLFSKYFEYLAILFAYIFRKGK